MKLLTDIFLIGGGAALVYGIGLWSPPLAFTVGGSALIFLGVALVRSIARSTREQRHAGQNHQDP